MVLGGVFMIWEFREDGYDDSFLGFDILGIGFKDISKLGEGLEELARS